MELHRKRMRRILDIAKERGNTVVILGAFGCGVFQNQPEVLAEAYASIIEEYRYDFEVIEFAVYCMPKDTRNYDVFKRRLNIFQKCPMHLNGHCPGCGGGEGNQSCKIARCSLQHDKPEYCSQCQEFPCEKYENINAFDSFITHQNQKRDLKKQQEIGVEAYQAEQEEKIRILEWLLENCNDG